MATAAAVAPADGAAADPPAKGSKKKLIILAVPVALLLVVAGLWFGGILPPLLGMGKPAEDTAEAKPAPDAHGAKSDAHGAKSAAAKPDNAHGAKPEAPKADAGHGAKPDAHGAKPAADAKGTAGAKAMSPNFLEMPDIIANLNVGSKRAVYVKLRTRVELVKAEDEGLVRAAMPRVLDLFQTYLREMRPEELRGSAGTYRLREELIARANIAVAPARIQDLLFVEMLIQ